MARVAPASDSFWAIPPAMLRLLARPKTTATLPLRSIMKKRIPFSTVCDLKDSSRARSVLSRLKVALTCWDNDRFKARLGVRLVKNNATAIPASVFGGVEGFVGASEERTGDLASGGLRQADADGKR